MKIQKLHLFTILLAIPLGLLAAPRGSLVSADSFHSVRLATFKNAWTSLQEREELRDMTVMMKIEREEWELLSHEYKAIYSKTERAINFREVPGKRLIYVDSTGAENKAVFLEISIIGVVLDKAEAIAGLYFSLIEDNPPNNTYMWFHISLESYRKWEVVERRSISANEYDDSISASRLFSTHSKNEYPKIQTEPNQ